MAKNGTYRIGGVCAIAGTVIAGISNGLHPALADPAGVVRNAADTSTWTTIHWGLIIGIVAMQLGFYTVIETLRASIGNNTNKGNSVLLASYMLTVGLVLWICVFTAEIGLKALADAVKTDTSSQIGALALASMADATATAATCLYFLGITLLGLALLLSDRYPRWMGITGLILGAVLTLTVGLRKAFIGPSSWTEGLPFQTLVVLFWIWTIILAVQLWRTSSRVRNFDPNLSPSLP